MESEYDPWSEQPLDLVKKKLTVSSPDSAAMGVSDLAGPKLGEASPANHELYLNEEDGNFYSRNQALMKARKAYSDERPKKFVLKVPTVKQEVTDSEATPWNDAQTQKPSPYSSSNNRSHTAKLPTDNKQSAYSVANKINAKKAGGQQGDRQEELSRFILQSPNLYSALCLNKAKTESMPSKGQKSAAKALLRDSPKDSSGMSAAYLEVFDKLMADYVKKLNAQGSLDNLENTVEGINLVLNNLAAYEQKLLSAMYMGSLINSTFPNIYPQMSHLSPLLAAQSLGSGFNPLLNPGFPLGLASSTLLHSGMSPELLASPLSSSAYQNLHPSERATSTPMSPPASSPASVSSSTNPSSTVTTSLPCNKLGSQDSLLRIKDFHQWRVSGDTQSSTPTSSITSLTTPTDLSNDESMSHSMSAASSGRSSSVSSTQNLTLSPLSSVGASPPLSSKSDSYSRPQLLNFSRSIIDHQKNSGSNSDNSKGQDPGNGSNNQEKKKPHIKKPLNAFMLYMKEMRQQVVSECTLKESAAINQILGRRWHALSREEQARYYELARKERQLHMQLYPDWSSRANTTRGKKRKRKQETNDGGNNMKKCRARYGLDQQSQWCKPCRRKKKCIRYMEAGGGGGDDDGNQSDDNLGSCGSVGEGDAHTPVDEDDDGDGDESMSQSHSLSSPGGLSGLSSLTSPSMILPSPSTSLASPSVSLASPCMSLQSPLTPLEYECKPPPPLPLSLSLPMYNHHHSPLLGPPLHRHPVGTNPHDINNPLSVNQLTGKCIKTEPSSSASSGSGGPSGPGPGSVAGPSAPAPAPSNIIRVT
ncbi:uncharacterized protein LOC117646745 isoform X2 [Thrips palmi]|uniref:dTCF n=1 Tax=Thrips palmi TaxID=161013 RepID=A0A6P8Z2C3_THRPL|nr:uncharacterized protein LOC117646745 isoform X2 [Thrips palmi]